MKGTGSQSIGEDTRDTPLRVERVPLIAASARPAVVLTGRPTAERAANAGARRNLALLFIEVAIQNNSQFGGVIREGAPCPILVCPVAAWPTGRQNSACLSSDGLFRATADPAVVGHLPQRIAANGADGRRCRLECLADICLFIAYLRRGRTPLE